jgi:hypothetical protein
MRKGILSIVFVLLANASLAWGQTTGDMSPDARAWTYPADEPQGSPSPSVGIGMELPKLPSVSQFIQSFQPRPEEGAKPHDPETGEDKEESEEAKRAQHLWVRGEYLLWFIKNSNLPPLVTSGSASDPRPGALGQPGTTVLVGGAGEDYFNRSGARFFAGYWFDDEQRWGLEVGYFLLAGISVGTNSSSPGNPVLARPFFNTSTGQQDSSIVAYPGVTGGNVLATTGSFMQGVELNMTSTLVRTEHFRFEVLGGFRYLNLNESVTINENDDIAVSPYYAGQAIPYAGNIISVNDYFTTRNDFFGGQLGFRAEYVYKRLSLEVVSKVALGCTNEVVNIHGNTSINTNPVTNYTGGLLALSSNSGQYTRDAFSVVPEVGLNLGFQLTNNIKIFGGYSFLYWTNIVRPGDQIDTSVNPNLIPTSSTNGTAGGAARPAFAFHANDFFAQGANFGLEFRY